MPGCIKRGYYVKGNFQYFCRSCYTILLGKLTITNDDFIAYLNLSFNANIKYPPIWCFRNIYNWCQVHVPSIKPLANILESIIYLKMIMAKH